MYSFITYKITNEKENILLSTYPFWHRVEFHSTKRSKSHKQRSLNSASEAWTEPKLRKKLLVSFNSNRNRNRMAHCIIKCCVWMKVLKLIPWAPFKGVLNTLEVNVTCSVNGYMWIFLRSYLFLPENNNQQQKTFKKH